MIQEQSFFTRVAHWFKDNSTQPVAEHVGSVGEIGEGVAGDGSDGVLGDGKMGDRRIGGDGLINPITDISD